MSTKSRIIKPLNYPPPTPDMIRQSASRLINSRIHGSLNGVQRRDLARRHSDPALREAARILDELDPIARPLSVAVQQSRQADQPLHPSSQPAVVGPALSLINGQGQPETGKFPTSGDHGSRQPVRVQLPPMPTPRRPLMQPSVTRREINGRFLPSISIRNFAGVRRLLRDLRESAKGGAS